MIEPIEMYRAICDGCNDIYEYDGFQAISDRFLLFDDLKEGDWVILEDETCYCPDCHIVEWDEEGENQFAFSIGVGKKLLGKIQL